MINRVGMLKKCIQYLPRDKLAERKNVVFI